VAQFDRSPFDRATTVAALEKRQYPPLQWWPLRVTNPWHKLGFLLGQVVLVRAFAAVLGLVLPTAALTIVIEAVFLVTIVALARSFRGRDEPVAPPRPWWRLTARPRAGWWLGLLFVLSGVVSLFPRDHVLPWWEVVQAVVSGLFGLALLNCAARLTFGRSYPQA